MNCVCLKSNTARARVKGQYFIIYYTSRGSRNVSKGVEEPYLGGGGDRGENFGEEFLVYSRYIFIKQI